MKTKVTTSNKTELAKRYSVSYSTFIKLLKEVPGLNLHPKLRTLTPKQVALIYDHLGEP